MAINAFSGRNSISKVVGNISGLKTGQLKRLERLGKKRIAPDLFVSHEIARSMAELSTETRRQIGVLIDRSGQVDLVIVGDAKQIVIPSLLGIRSSGGRLKGLRCIHTHLAGENLTDDDLLDLLFLRLDLMGIIKMRPDGYPEKLYSAHLVPSPIEGRSWSFLEPFSPGQQPFGFDVLIGSLEEEFSRLQPLRAVDEGKDRAILISVITSSRFEGRDSARESMDELVELAHSDDVIILDTVIQQRKTINPKHLICP